MVRQVKRTTGARKHLSPSTLFCSVFGLNDALIGCLIQPRKDFSTLLRQRHDTRKSAFRKMSAARIARPQKYEHGRRLTRTRLHRKRTLPAQLRERRSERVSERAEYRNVEYLTYFLKDGYVSITLVESITHILEDLVLNSKYDNEKRNDWN